MVVQILNVEKNVRIPGTVNFSMKNEREGKPIEMCVWDVGGVIYNYSLEHLFELTKQKTRNLEGLSENSKRFSYGPFMRGEQTFTEFCKYFFQIVVFALIIHFLILQVLFFLSYLLAWMP